MKYKHFFTCPVCEWVSSFVDSEKIPKDSTFETSCECGIRMHEYWKSKKMMDEKSEMTTFNEIEKMCIFNYMEQWRTGASGLCEDMTECATHHILYWKIPDSKYKKCPLCSIAEKFGVKKMKLSKKEYEDMLLDNGYEKNHIKTISDFMYS